MGWAGGAGCEEGGRSAGDSERRPREVARRAGQRADYLILGVDRGPLGEEQFDRGRVAVPCRQAEGGPAKLQRAKGEGAGKGGETRWGSVQWREEAARKLSLEGCGGEAQRGGRAQIRNTGASSRQGKPRP